MRCVIFDPEDMEAVTVIQVPDDFLHEIGAGKRPPYLNFAVYKPLTFADLQAVDSAVLEPPPIATILFERFQRNGVWTWCGIATNVELALALKSEFLPGQQKEAWAERRKGVFEGLGMAFKGMGYE